MIKHIVMWQKISDDFECFEEIKNDFKGLVGQIPGLLSISFEYRGLKSGTHNIVLESTHESLEALDIYRDSPLHKAISAKLKFLITGRVAIDYIM